MTELVKDYREWRKQEGLPWNANFVPKAFDGLPDLEQKYWLAEQKAIAFERNRDVTKSIEVKKALPPARPRRKPLIRKGKKPGTVIIAKSGEFGRPELELMMEGIADAFEMFRKDAIGPLEKRIAELEARPELTFGGPWKDGQSYPEKCLCQHQGGLWLSKTPNNTARPGGESPAWRLVVKKGSAG